MYRWCAALTPSSSYGTSPYPPRGVSASPLDAKMPQNGGFSSFRLRIRGPRLPRRHPTGVLASENEELSFHRNPIRDHHRRDEKKLAC